MIIGGMNFRSLVATGQSSITFINNNQWIKALGLNNSFVCFGSLPSLLYFLNKFILKKKNKRIALERISSSVVMLFHSRFIKKAIQSHTKKYCKKHFATITSFLSWTKNVTYLNQRSFQLGRKLNKRRLFREKIWKVQTSNHLIEWFTLLLSLVTRLKEHLVDIQFVVMGTIWTGVYLLAIYCLLSFGNNLENKRTAGQMLSIPRQYTEHNGL